MQNTDNSPKHISSLLRGCTVLLRVSHGYAIILVLLNIASGLIDPLNAIVYQKLLDCIVGVLKENSKQNICVALISLLLID